MRKLALLMIAAAGLWACEEQGPLEREGEEADETIEDAQQEGETLGNRLDDAIDQAREDVEEATENNN